MTPARFARSVPQRTRAATPVHACLALAVVPCLAAWASAQGVTWTKLSPQTSPSGRIIHRAAYDSARDRVVMFGGQDTNGVWVDETWEWDGADWSLRRPVGAVPSPRFAAVAYDAARARTLLFGGNIGNTRYDDTWEWDGNAWTQRQPANRPPTRNAQAMAYDSARQRIVLFGGVDVSGVQLGDTWEWDGNDWTQRTPANSPPPRGEALMAYDAARGRMVLFGGGLYAGGPIRGDTWEWDGNDWQEKLPASPPPPRTGHRMVYDASRQVVVLFGGGDGTTRFDGTWEWDGTAWTRRSIARPPANSNRSLMVYVGSAQRTLLFGGNGSNPALAETWSYGPVSAPTLTGISPGSVPNRGAVEITLTGTDLLSTSQVSIGSQTAASLQVVSPTTVRFRLADPAEIGSQLAVTVTTDGGMSNAVHLDVTGTHPAQLVADAVGSRGFPVSYRVHGDRGWINLMLVSPSNAPSVLPGIVSLDIGAGFTQLFEVGTFANDSRGFATLGIAYPTLLPPFFQVHAQLITINPTNPGFPLEVSNAVVTTLL